MGYPLFMTRWKPNAKRCIACAASGNRTGGYRYQRKRDASNEFSSNWRDEIPISEDEKAQSADDSVGEEKASYREANWVNSDWAQESTSQSDNYAGWSSDDIGSAGDGVWGGNFGKDPQSGSNRSSANRTKTKSSSTHLMDIFPLKEEDLQTLFPFSGTQSQYSYYWGTWDQAVQRFAVSLLTTLVATNSSPVLAAGAFSYCLWGPIAQSVLRNISVKKYSYGGFWTAAVLDLRFKEPLEPGQRGDSRENRFSTPSSTIIHVGAEKVADVVIEVPYENAHEFIQIGDPAYVVVVSNSPSLTSFKAVRDLFLPATRTWMCEYPFISRQGFKEVAQKALYFMNNQGNKNWRS